MIRERLTQAIQKCFMGIAWFAVMSLILLLAPSGHRLAAFSTRLVREIRLLSKLCWLVTLGYVAVWLMWSRREVWWPWLRQKVHSFWQRQCMTEQVPAEERVAQEPTIQATPAPAESTCPIWIGPPPDLLGRIADRSPRNGEPIARQLPAAFAALGIPGVEVVDWRAGPVVTAVRVRYPAGVRATRLIALKADLAAELGVEGVRITPAWGEGGVLMVEVPFTKLEVVPLRRLVEDQAFWLPELQLPAALGVDLTGQPTIADVARMPHLLIAGTTGSGKSVCIHSLLVSLLYRCSPEELRLVLVDPKVVELTRYDGLPHLVEPVITESAPAIAALEQAVTEMQTRYSWMSKAGVRNIVGYNQKARAQGKATLPYKLLVLDEFGDLIEEDKKTRASLEQNIKRLAAKARAAGIHLVLATQRPSVDVITGVIKANIPSRVAFAVASQVDSVTILGTTGAEDLRGQGDMLYAPIGARHPVRCQGAFVAESAIAGVVEWWQRSYVSTEQKSPLVEQEQSATGSKVASIDEPTGEREQMPTANFGRKDSLWSHATMLALQRGYLSERLLREEFSIARPRAKALLQAALDERLLLEVKRNRCPILLSVEERRDRLTAMLGREVAADEVVTEVSPYDAEYDEEEDAEGGTETAVAEN